MTSTRTYTVTQKFTEDGRPAKPRLVVAANPAQALRHVAQDTYEVKVASGVTVGKAMGDGAILEYASGEA
jgi:hypothetical protein